MSRMVCASYHAATCFLLAPTRTAGCTGEFMHLSFGSCPMSCSTGLLENENRAYLDTLNQHML